MFARLENDCGNDIFDEENIMKKTPLVPDGMSYTHTCDVLVVGGGFGGKDSLKKAMGR